jgi:hypothetical protein
MRPLSINDLITVANYLLCTKAKLRTALSELGFDPDRCPRIRAWLRELHVRQEKTTHLWIYEE